MPIETGVSNILQIYVTQSQLAALAFLDLTDTPSSYSGAGLKKVMVNGGATGLWFADPAVTEFPGHLKLNTTRYLMPGWSFSETVDDIPTGGLISYIPIFVIDTTTYTELHIYVNVAGNGSDVDIRLFAWNNGVPGAQIASFGTIATTSTGDKSLAINATLDRGFYFIALRPNNSTGKLLIIHTAYAYSSPVIAIQTVSVPGSIYNLETMTVSAAYADPAPAPTALDYRNYIILLREN